MALKFKSAGWTAAVKQSFSLKAAKHTPGGCHSCDCVGFRPGASAYPADNKHNRCHNCGHSRNDHS